MAEPQELLHVMRDPATAGPPPRPVPAAPPPELASLVAGRAELVEDGDPGSPSPMVRRTAHRIVQESLTNAGKHAPGAPSAVEPDTRS